MLSKTDSKLRNNAKYITVALCVVMAVLNIGSLVRVVFIEGDKYRRSAQESQLNDTAVPALRGTIYDSNMNVLSNSSYAWKVCLSPNLIKTEETRKDVAKELSKVLKMDYDEVYSQVNKPEDQYEVVKEEISATEKTELTKYIAEEKLGNIIYFTPDSVRYYSNETLASTVIGHLNADGVGISGLEGSYNEMLTGVPGRIVTAKNAHQDNIESDYESVIEAKQGVGLLTTIDMNIQYFLEKALVQGTADAKAKGAYGIVMDVDTGAVLGMASLPDYDPNNAYRIADDLKRAEIDKLKGTKDYNKEYTTELFAQWKNNSVSYAYEPGSIFKVFTLSTALEEGVVNESETYNCTGSYFLAGNTIHCAKREGHGHQTLTQGLMNSCNPFFVNVGQKIGTDTFYRYFKAFGFTEKTGIDLPAEFKPVAGSTFHLEDSFTIANLGSCSFGQTFKISAIQVITAISCVANGGKLMQPYVIKATVDGDGNILSTTEPTVRRQVISESTSDRVCSMMEQVVASGTGKNAYIPGYRVAGKTATSQKIDTKDERLYVASFACFAPADDPEVAILIVVDEPMGVYHSGSMVAAPIAKEVMQQTLTYLNVQPEYSTTELKGLNTIAPNLVGTSVAGAKQLASQKGFSVKVVGSGDKIKSQMPVANTSIPSGGVIIAYTEGAEQTSKVKVPLFSGMTVSQVNATAVAYGLNVTLSGPSVTSKDTVAYKQSVEAGEEVEAGSSMIVYFHSTSDTVD